MEANALMWFRKGLRIHDNPALDHARRGATKTLYPVFVLDPRYLERDPTAFSPGSAFAGLGRIQFLLESLADLDKSLRSLGSRLVVLRGGDPADVLIRILREWNIGKLCYESDTEPYGQARDSRVKDFATASGIEVFSPVSHTLFDPAHIIRKNGGKPPLAYQSFVKLAGRPPPPIGQPFSTLPPVGDLGNWDDVGVPTIQELGYGDVGQVEFSPFRGGESEALKRMAGSLADKEWVAKFEKPKGDPSAFMKPATTVLSPYLKFGCLSARLLYEKVEEIYASSKKHTSPPVSLVGQLLWREFFYTAAFGTPNFDRMRGNGICKQIPWRDDDKLLASWRDGRTGFPWIDAIMIQLRQWGWMHHLARHSVACFLTRGDLFIHWEKGRDVFERLLIDSDWAINNGNWMWLSCSSFFYQYHRIYSPVTFGKKYDPTGKFIRHFLPVLKDMPKEYIYEPWTAPDSVQRRAKCIIGRDYPRPVVSHEVASKQCRQRMGEAYALNGVSQSQPSDENLENLRRKFDQEESTEVDQAPRLKQKRLTA